MTVLVWIGQILLFFVLWWLFSWGSRKVLQPPVGMGVAIAVNVVCAIVLLIIFHTVHSAWWLMGIVGADVGIATGISALWRRA